MEGGACARGRDYLCLLALLVWLLIQHTAQADLGTTHEEAPLVPACSMPSSGVVRIPQNCTLGSPVAAASSLSVLGSRRTLGTSATPVIFASAAAKQATTPGLRLQLERLVLTGFNVAAPEPGTPLLWPGGLTEGTGTYLNMTDCRVLVTSQALFNKYLEYFANQNTVLWTDNTNFIHIQHWSDAHTQLKSVGLLLAGPGPGGPPAAPPDLPYVKNCLYLMTNASLLPALIPHAAIATPLPLLVYLTSNVSIGLHPPLSAQGVVIKRPIVFVGLWSVVTSIDFEMVVNQLNATGSPYSNTTFVGVVLENLAPGDVVTSAVASPFSIAITNNVWAVYFNRSVPHEARWALYNVTLVLSQDSEMSYVTYMFTLYSSPLPSLKAQTEFYSSVLHMSMLQFAPGPGDHAITVSHLYSWYHRWGEVIITTQPLVAKELPLPPRPAVLTTSTRTSPLVQAVRNTQELLNYAAQPVVGDREHILLFLANVSLPTSAPRTGSSAGAAANGNSSNKAVLQLTSQQAWVGYNPGMAASSLLALIGRTVPSFNGRSERVTLDCGYQQSVVDVQPTLPKAALQLQQLVLANLPQAADAEVPTQFKAVPSTLLTTMLWSFKRPYDVRTLNLMGVTLLVPPPELDYFRAFAQRTNDFVVEVTSPNQPAGQRPDGLTFEDAYMSGDELQAASMTGPGFTATNVTLRPDPNALSGMPGGHHWPDPNLLQLPTSTYTQTPPWVTAVTAVCVTLGVALLALGAFLWWQRKRICLRDPEAQLLPADSSFNKGVSHCSCHSQSQSPTPHYMGGGGGGNNSSRPSSLVVSHGGSSSTGACALHQHVRSHRADSSRSTDQQGVACEQGSRASSSQGVGFGGKSGGGAAATAAGAAGGLGLAAAAAAGDDAGPPPRSPHGRQQQQRQRLGGGSGGSGQDTLAPRDAAAASIAQHGEQQQTSQASLPNSVAAGMQRWRAAVSSTTMLLMERRMNAHDSGSTGTKSSAAPTSNGAPAAAGAAATAAGAGDQGNDAGAQQQQQQQEQDSGNGTQQLQLQELLGQGSFGSVFLALWRGKRVAVKIMQLPASALMAPGERLGLGPEDLQEQPQPGQEGDEDGSASGRRRRQQVQQRKQQNSPPHMAIMEAVVSSTMSHPNVVQVFTYMISPITSPCKQTENGQAAEGDNEEEVTGWSIKLVMEWCNQGSLRDALDCGLLAKPGALLAPSAVLALAHDVAAAMLHLHSEGIVHGDLKAGNVMLTSSGGGAGALSGLRMWGFGDRSLTAKVADFGLAMPLGPQDTHATLLARGTPTHMSPEIFINGHISKASDVYAYGILLYEVMTGQRAYQGVPIPLLPHEVAVKGLRPVWPTGLPPGCRDLRKLAEACWAQEPQNRPTFTEILRTLDVWSAGGHGWPAVAPSSSSTQLVPRFQPQPQQQAQQTPQQQSQQQLHQQQHRDVQDGGELAQQPQRQQQAQQTGQAQQQQQQQQQQGQQPQQQGEAPLPQQQLQRQQQQQRQQQPRPAGSPTPGAAAGARNIYMSWSEVDMNNPGDHGG